MFKNKEEISYTYQWDIKKDITTYELAQLLQYRNNHIEIIDSKLPDECKRHLKKIKIIDVYSWFCGIFIDRRTEEVK